MALTPKLSNVGANASADGICALCNAGFIDIYDGAQPATADTAIGAQVMLVRLTFGSPAFSAAVAGVATANAITFGVAAATGTAAWFRAYETDGVTALFDGSVGTGTTNIVLTSTAITIGGTVLVTALTYTQAKS